MSSALFTKFASMPGAIPLLSIALFALQSWHCIIMCGPLYSMKTGAEKNSYLLGRTISYAMGGLLFGLAGQKLVQLAELKVFAILAYFVFAACTIILITVWIGKQHLLKFTFVRRFQLSPRTSFFQGLASLATPCGSLVQMFSLSLLTKSWFGGLLIGLGQASVSSFYLWAGNASLKRLLQKVGRLKFAIRAMLAILVVLNLWEFSKLLLDAQKTQPHVIHPICQ